MRVAVLIAGALVLGACTETVQHQIEERAATEVVVTLDHYGIPAERLESGDGLFDIRVARSQRREAMAVLAARGLPRRAPPPDPALAASSSLVPSPHQERVQRLAATTAALESTLAAMDGVLDARVHAVVPSAERLGATPEPPRASVVIVDRLDGGAPDDDAIRAVVVGAIEGLNRDSVSIVRSSVELPEPPAASLAQVGPWTVVDSSVAGLRAVLAALAGAVAVLAVLVIALALRSSVRAAEGGRAP